ncbi:MAG: NAD(P)/FAD-dependent oxidoreductase [Desulfobacterales bacterium]
MSKNVAIIGASTAGLLTAKKLADHGMSVKVFEASKQIDSRPRSLIVTGQLPKLLGPLYRSALVNVIRRFELYADGRVAQIALKRPDLVIERSKLLRDLEAEAKLSGAGIFTRRRFLSLKPNGKHLAFSLAGNGNGAPIEEYADVLVGADGAFSRVAKSGGWPKPDTVPLIQAVVKLPLDMPSDTTRVWFLPEHTPFFYWLIPHSSTHGVLGLIADEAQKGRKVLDHFLDRKNLEPIEFQSAPIPIYTRWIPIHRKIGHNDVYLVGDAAGQVKASTVGGVVTGFRGALSVVDSILNNKRNHNLKRLRRELDLHSIIRKSLQGFSQADYVKLLDMLNPSTLRALSSLNRDQTPKLLFHLLASQPKLLLMGLRTILLNSFPFSK